MDKQKISKEEDRRNHVYTYIHTYMEKRRREDNTKNTNVIFYDGKDLIDLQEICLRNGTNVSSVVSNLIREFNLLFKSKTPQRTLFNFEEVQKLHFNTDRREAENYLRSLSDDAYHKWATVDLQMWLELERKVTRLR